MGTELTTAPQGEVLEAMPLLPRPLTEINRGPAITEPAPPTSILIRSEKPSELAKALAAARDKCRAAPHDRTNSFQKFDYASAEAIIVAAKEALDGSGLTLVPSAPKLTVTGSGNFACHSMVRSFVLIHSSGESLSLGAVEWPVIADKGRPLDKAFAISITSSLGYVYRDLLSMPRIAADEDMAGRDDRGTTSPTRNPGKPNPVEEPAAKSASPWPADIGEQPYDADDDENEVIKADQYDYLLRACASKGHHSEKALVLWVHSHFGRQVESLRDLTVGEYRKMLALAAKWRGQRAKAKAS